MTHARVIRIFIFKIPLACIQIFKPPLLVVSRTPGPMLSNTRILTTILDDTWAATLSIRYLRDELPPFLTLKSMHDFE